MTIAAKDSLGVFAECPNCHASICHGFQVCQQCGARVSAEQQRGLQRLIAKNVLSFAVVALVLFGCLFYFAYKTLQ